MVRASLALVAAAVLLLPPSPPAFPGDKEGAKDPAPESAGAQENRITEEHQRAIDRGLAYLDSRQCVDGSFPASSGDDASSKGADYKTAVTALSTLAFLGAGHGLRHDRYQETVRKAVRWLLKAQADNSIPGYVSCRGDSQSKMHGHGFATLALAEAYGTAGSADAGENKARGEDEQELHILSLDLKAGIQAAVDCIERSQAKVGGWFYVPGAASSEHEGSVTVCQVQALLAASNRGFVVSMDRIRKAREYMKLSQASGGGFKYTLSTVEDETGRAMETFALTAAGITTLVGLAEFDRKEALDRAYRYLDRAQRPDVTSGTTRYPFYGSFYGVQAYHWIGGDRWRNYWLPLRGRILRSQQRDGDWTGKDTQAELGNVYPTAFCLLMLEVPVGYLSIYAK